MIRSMIHAGTREPAGEAVQARFRTADDLLGVRLSEQEIIYPVRLHLEYVPYSDILWAYRRLEESHVNLGCCGGVLEEHKLMLVTRSGKTHVVSFDRERYIQYALELLAKRAPHIAVGFTQENKLRFAASPTV